MRKNGLRGLVEIGFIVFLFYCNLLMGEFERSGSGRKNGSRGPCLTFSQLQILRLLWQRR
jgi:hypothetical protein